MAATLYSFLYLRAELDQVEEHDKESLLNLQKYGCKESIASILKLFELYRPFSLLAQIVEFQYFL